MGLFEQGAGWLKKTFSSNPPESKKPPPREWSKHYKEVVVPTRLKKSPHLEKMQFKTTEHPLVLKYQPVPLGSGKEHGVFVSPDSPNSVIRTDNHAMLNIASWNTKNGLPSDAESKSVNEYREERLNQERERFQQLKKYFGAEHVLPQKMFFMKVPINEGMIEEIKELAKKTKQTEPKFTSNEAWTMVTVQRRAKELENPDRLDVQGVNLEIRNRYDLTNTAASQAYYRRFTEPLLNDQTAAETELDQTNFKELIILPALDHLLDAAQKDEGLREALKDFCERAAKYANTTGEIVDFSGEDNVIFFKKPDGRWSYQLIDALYGYIPKALNVGREEFFRGQAASSAPREATALFQAVNFTRLINGLGKLVGAKTFVDFLPPERSGMDDVLSLMFPSAKASQLEQGRAGKVA